MDLDLAHDYLNLDDLFTPDELALRDRVRAFVDERIRPNIAGWYATATFPRELVKEMADLGLLGMHLKGYGCAGPLAPSSTASPRWSWRPATPASAPSSPCRARSP